jgi:hypothetical protein
MRRRGESKEGTAFLKVPSLARLSLQLSLGRRERKLIVSLSIMKTRRWFNVLLKQQTAAAPEL